jgi:elongation factor G
MAFQHAGALALREAAGAAGVSLLEPVDTISVLVSDEYVGSVMSDLSGRRGRVSGSEPVGTGRTQIHADVPQLELTRYAVELRSISHGTATFVRHYRGHEPMPPQIAKRLQDDDQSR